VEPHLPPLLLAVEPHPPLLVLAVEPHPPPLVLAVEPHPPLLLQLVLEVAHHQPHLPQLPPLQALQLEALLHHQVCFVRHHKLLLDFLCWGALYELRLHV